MKKLNLLYLALFALVAVACSDDDDKPSFKKEDFYAEWQLDGSEDAGCTDVIKIDASKFFSGTKCGTTKDYDDGISYTFESNAFKMTELGLEIKYVITSKTATTFKADGYLNGAKLGAVSYTKL